MTETTVVRPAWDAVLFDLDGTLADTVDLILSCYRHTMRTHLGAPRPDDEWLESIGRPLPLQLRRFARSESEASAMLRTYVEYQREVHDRMTHPFPGVGELLDGLDARGVRAGLVTSKARGVAVRTMARCGIGGRFATEVFADDVSAGKPDPEPVLLAVTRLGDTDPARVLFVGDSPHDMAAGRAAGVRTGAALWGPCRRDAIDAQRPDYAFADVPALQRFLFGPPGSAG